MPEPADIARTIERKALELGFSACGFAAAEPLAALETDFRSWISEGNAGEMAYLARNIDVRIDPGKLVEGAKTIISLAASYYFPLPEQVPGNTRVSRYALGEDYHLVLKSLARELLGFINSEAGPVMGRVFTDSAPIFEREWARRAGIGWIGKNGCLIIPRQGSWFFLAEIVTDLEIPAEPAAVPDRCGSCTRCIDACPTRALHGDGSMDPRRCISYLTIEHRGDIPVEFKGRWKDWVFGCDICQEVCPWNSKPTISSIPGLQPRIDQGETDWEKFTGTPVVRAGLPGIFRNFEFLETTEP